MRRNSKNGWFVAVRTDQSTGMKRQMAIHYRNGIEIEHKWVDPKKSVRVNGDGTETKVFRDPTKENTFEKHMKGNRGNFTDKYNKPDEMSSNESTQEDND